MDNVILIPKKIRRRLKSRVNINCLEKETLRKNHTKQNPSTSSSPNLVNTHLN